MDKIAGGVRWADSGQLLAGDNVTQRVGGLTIVPALLRELGVAPAPALAAVGLAAGALDDPDATIQFATVSRLLHNAAKLSGCAHFGLLVGRSMRLSDLGLVGQLAQHSPTVGQALRTFAVYQHLNSQAALAFVLERHGMVESGYAIYRSEAAGNDQVYAVAMSCALNIMRGLCGDAWIPTEVCFAHPKPIDSGPYRRLFQCPLRFDAEYTALRFPAAWMQHCVAHADPERYRSALVRGEAATRAHLLQQVQRALRTLLISGTVSGDAVAQLLAMHRRTLNRRLKEQGTTFQEVLDKVRFEVARQLLGGTRISIDDVAAALGYASVSPFTRTFRRWAGTTPGQWRRGVLSG